MAEKTSEDYSNVSRIEFTKDHVRNYLDGAIDTWRTIRDCPTEDLGNLAEQKPLAEAYIDAYQTVRASLFGEILP